MRYLTGFIGAIALLSALAIILLHVTGKTVGADGMTIFFSVIGCLVVGAVSLNWAVYLEKPAPAAMPDKGRKAG